MSDALYILRAKNVAARRIGDELMIMSAHDSALFNLNQTAAILWDAADGTTPLADIVSRDICPLFDIDPVTALNDARETATSLAEHGILHVSPNPLAERSESSS